MVLVALYIFLYSIISAVFNYDIIAKKDFHKSQAVLRVYTFIGILAIPSMEPLMILSGLFQSLTIYWIVFDLALNLLRGKDFLYIGKTAWLDKTLGKYIYLIKFIFIIISVFLGYV